MATKEKETKFRPMKEYSPSECEFVIFEEKHMLTWTVLPSIVVKKDFYEIRGKRFSLIEMIALNSFTQQENAPIKTKDFVMNDLLKAGYKFSHKLSEMISEVGYNVYWVH